VSFKSTLDAVSALSGSSSSVPLFQFMKMFLLFPHLSYLERILSDHFSRAKRLFLLLSPSSLFFYIDRSAFLNVGCRAPH